MPAGVEGFVPGRLRMAREARALRQIELAHRVDRTAATISKWENDEQPQRPEPAVLPVLAQALDVEVSWFLKPLEKQRHSAAFFRSLKTELEMMRLKAKGRLDFVEAIEHVLSEHVDLPEVDVPDLLNGQHFASLRFEDIDAIAGACREHWDLGDGPIDDLMVVIENAGVVVAEDQIGSEKLDGLSRWALTNGRPYMLLAQDKRVGVRRRLDAAHELGHIILHRFVTPQELEDHFRLIEDQAMWFAGAFLLPQESYADDIFSLSLDAMLSVKKKWKVSVGAQIKRLSNIKKFSDHYERRLWQYYSHRRWRTCEPYDDEIEIEQPINLKEAIQLLIDEDGMSRDELVREIGISRSDICALTGLPESYLSPVAENLVRLKPKLRDAEAGDAQKQAEVIPWNGRRR